MNVKNEVNQVIYDWNKECKPTQEVTVEAQNYIVERVAKIVQRARLKMNRDLNEHYEKKINEEETKRHGLEPATVYNP